MNSHQQSGRAARAGQSLAMAAARTWASLRGVPRSRGLHASEHGLDEARRRSFVAAHAVAGLVALAALPVHLLFAPALSLEVVLIYLWLCVPIGAAAIAARGGALLGAHVISTMGLTGLVVYAASITGGLSSFATFWLIAIPAEAALSGSLIAVGVSAGAALLGLAFLGLVLPASGADAMLTLIGALSAAAYVTLITVGNDRFGRMRERMLRERDEAFSLLADHASDAITRHDPSGRLTYATAAAEAVFGDAPTALHGHGLRDRLHVLDRVVFLQAIRRASEGLEETVEFRVRRADHAYRWIEMRCRALGGSDGAGDGVVCVSRDIQRRKDHEAQLTLACEEADRANGAKMQFLASVSHELRTPLNAIIGFSDMLGGDIVKMLSEEQRHEYAGLINQSGKHLLQVVNDVLDVSKLEAGHFTVNMEEFDPAVTARDCCQMLGSQISEGGLKLVQDFDDVPGLHADCRAFRQILINLLGNAHKFTEPGGTITLRMRASARHLTVEVRDTGIGIAKDDLSRLGQPFVQAENGYDRRFEGTGLGLSVVRGLVELHEGTFRIDSELGLGTCVTLTFPLEGVADANVTKLPIREVA